MDPRSRRMAAESFTDTFAHLYKPQDLAAFLDETFGPDGLPAQIGRPDYPHPRRRRRRHHRRLRQDRAVPPPFPRPAPEGAAELHQLYVLKGWQGSGVAPR